VATSSSVVGLDLLDEETALGGLLGQRDLEGSQAGVGDAQLVAVDAQDAILGFDGGVGGGEFLRARSRARRRPKLDLPGEAERGLLRGGGQRAEAPRPGARYGRPRPGGRRGGRRPRCDGIPVRRPRDRPVRGVGAARRGRGGPRRGRRGAARSPRGRIRRNARRRRWRRAPARPGRPSRSRSPARGRGG
jgi:hypothetical protein